MEKKQIENYDDQCNEMGFQFEFHCDICGNSFQSEFVNSSSYGHRKRTEVLGNAASFVGNILGGKLGSIGDMIDHGTDVINENKDDEAYLREKEEAFLEAEEEAKKHLHRCKKCNRWVCDECYNAKTGLCRDCYEEKMNEEMYKAQEREERRKEKEEEQKEKEREQRERQKEREREQREKEKEREKAEKKAKKVVCSKCGAEIPEGMKFCGQCGAPVIREKICPNCGTKNDPKMNFCGQCGTKLD